MSATDIPPTRGWGRRALIVGGLLAGFLTFGASPAAAQGVFARGDCDQSGIFNITDAIAGLSYLFLGSREPPCLDACDVDDSGVLNISDAIYSLSFLFLGSADPKAPFPLEDPDPTADDLTCRNGREPPAELRVSPPELFFQRVGNAQALTVVAKDAAGALEDVRTSRSTRFSSSAPAVAEVSADGIVTARAVGRAAISVRYRGATRESSVVVLPGADGAPAVRITSPADGSIVTSARVTLSGFVTDRQASLKAGALALENRAGFFHASVDVAPGASTIEVVATGAAGEGRAAVTVTRAEAGSPEAVGADGKPIPQFIAPERTQPDSTPPVLAITSPAAGTVFLTGAVEVAGSIDDPAALVLVEGAPAVVVSGTFRAQLHLVPGIHVIVAEAIDPVGNRAQASVQVSVDASAPRVAITEPVGVVAGSSGGATVTVRGTVDPQGTPTSVQGTAARVTGSAWSVDLALPAGMNEIIATASLPGVLPRQGQAVRAVFVDAEGPAVGVIQPPESKLLSAAGYRSEVALVRFAGRIRDPGVPRELEGPLTLAIGGVPAVISNGTFTADLVLSPGVNSVHLAAADARGKTTARDFKVVVGGSPAPAISIISGDGQAMQAGQAAPLQLVAEARDATGAVQRSVSLDFRVVLGDGTLDGGVRSRSVLTAANGRASVSLTAGGEAGTLVVAVGGLVQANSPAAFVLKVNASTDRVLAAHRSRLFTGVAGQDLPVPIEARLLERHGNVIAGEAIVFRVIEGDAKVPGGNQSSVVTDAVGVASVIVRLPAGADSRSVIQAAIAGAEPVTFEALGLLPGAAAETEVSGAALDDRGQPVGGATIRAETALGALEVVTDAHGGFRLTPVPSGDVLLSANVQGYEAAPIRAFAVPGRRNRLDAPLRLVRSGHAPSARLRSELVSETRGALMTLPAVPGLRLAIAPGSATFPDGTRSGTITLAAPDLGALPSPAPDDARVDVPIAIFPAGVRFDPPASLSVPSARDAAGRTVPFFVHGAAAGGFVELPGGVAGEGTAVIAVDAARGARTGGIFFFAQPGPAGGRTGTLSGRVSIPAPGLLEVPECDDSLVLGFNVYAHSGELFIEETDLELPSPGRGIPYRFRRRYESRHNFIGSLGSNWEHEYEDRRLYPALGGGNVVRATGTGRFDEYLHDAQGGLFVSPVGIFSRLFTDHDGFFIEREPDGTRYRYSPLDGSPAAGRLESITDRTGARIHFARDEAGLIMEAGDALGRTVTYHHNAEGRITRITDFTGREVTFEYDTRGDLAAVTSPVVTDSPSGNNFPDGTRREYAYSHGFMDERLNHNLTQVIDPREAVSTKIPRVTVVYGTDASLVSFDRVVSEVWGGTNATGVSAGGTVTFDYDVWRVLPEGSMTAGELESFLLSTAGTTRFVDQEGRPRDVVWSGAGLPLSLRIDTVEGSRPRDPANLHPPFGTVPPYYETRWTWTREGLLSSMAEPRGGRSVFVHDESCPIRHGQAALVRKEEQPVPTSAGPGKSAVTTYLRDPLFGVIVEEVSPRGNDPDFEPPVGGAGGPARYRTRRLVDYQEGADLNTLAAEAGVATGDLSDALTRAGMLLGLGDSNGDGDVAQRFGNAVREVPPPATPPDGGPVEESFSVFRHNRFGQLVSRTDPAGRTMRFEYHPEADFNGDGVPDPGGARDAVTGGLLARRIADHGAAGSPADAVEESFAYDARGYLAKRADGNGNEEFHAYNALGKLSQVRLAPPLKYRRHSIYDLDGNLAGFRVENYTSTDGGGHFLVSENRFIDTNTEYDLLGRPVTETREVSEGEVGLARNIVTRYRYNASGTLARVIHPVAGTDETWEYDERSLAIEHRTAQGTSDETAVAYFLGEDGRVVMTRGDTPGGVEDRTYDGFGRLAAVIDAAGGARILERDIEGNVIAESILGSPGGPTPGTRDGAGNVLLRRVCSVHDERGRLIESRRARFEAGAGPGASVPVLTERWFHDGAGLLARRIDPEAGVWTFERDGAGRLIREKDPLGGSRTLTLDGNGNVVREVRESLTLDPVNPGFAGDPEYDAQGRYREARTILRVFDPLNRITLLCDTGGGTWRARYDAMSNLIFTSDSKGITVDPAGDPELAPILDLMTPRQLQSPNDHGNRTRYVYDNLGRLVEARHELRGDGEGSSQIDVTNPFNGDGIITEKFEWDDNDRLSAWEDDDGSRTQVEYNGAGHVAKKTWADGTFDLHRRTRDGRLFELTDANGTVITQELDALGRLTSRSIARAAGVEGTSLQRFEYDGLSRVTLAFDDNAPEDPSDDSITLFRRDSEGNVLEEMEDGFSMTAAYDLGGRVTSRRYPDGTIVETPRDRAGRVTSLADASGQYVACSYFGSGALLEKRLASGLVLSFLKDDGHGVLRNRAYNPFGEVLEQIYRDGHGAVVHGFEYGRDRSGYKLHEKALHRIDRLGEVWRYDSVYRLQRFLPNVFDPLFPPVDPVEKLVFYPDGNHSWRFLEVNFSVRRLSVNPRGAYTKSDDDALTYDARGNLRGAGQLAFTYDALCRLVKVENGGNLAANYTYDAADAADPEAFAGKGRRVAKDVKIPGREQPAGFIHFTFAGDHIVEERGRQAEVLRQFYYTDGGSPEVLLANRAGASRVAYAVLQDAAGSPTALINPEGGVEETVRYGVNGQPQVYNKFGSPIEFSGLESAIGFGGLYHDFEVHFHVAGARHFDPAFARFITDTSSLLPSAPLQLNGYVSPGIPGMPGEIAGHGSATRNADYLEPFRVRVFEKGGRQ